MAGQQHLRGMGITLDMPELFAVPAMEQSLAGMFNSPQPVDGGTGFTSEWLQEQLALIADAEASLSSSLSCLLARMVRITELAGQDGVDMPFSELTEQIDKLENERHCRLRQHSAIFSDQLPALKRSNPPAYRAISAILRRDKDFTERYAAKCRSARAKLHEIAKRHANRDKASTKMFQALAAYEQALAQVFPSAKFNTVTLHLADDMPVYSIEVFVHEHLYRNSRDLVALENKALDLVQEAAPNFAGFFALDFKPFHNAS